MKRRIEQKLDDLYATMPDVNCLGHCAIACGPISMSEDEWRRLREYSGREPTIREDQHCTYLTAEMRCSVHPVRPTICFLPDTQVFTEFGPRAIKEVLAGDRVYDMRGELATVVGTSSRYYQGLIYNVQFLGTHLPCWCTDRHLWWVTTQIDKRKHPNPYWKAANELVPKEWKKAGDYLSFPRHFSDKAGLETISVLDFVAGLAEGGRLKSFTGFHEAGRFAHTNTLPLEIAIDEEFLFMLGLFLAEGSASSRTACFSMHSNERPILDRVQAYLAKLGVSSSYRANPSKPNALHLQIPSPLFGQMMMSLAGRGAYQKRVDGRLFGELSHNQKLQLYKAWDVGDGQRFNNNTGHRTTTVSSALVAQMQFICLAASYFPRIYSHRYQPRLGPTYDLHLFPSNFREACSGQGTKIMYDDSYVYAGVRELEKALYCGPVVDIQVGGSESFVTSSGIAHNCRLFGVSEGLLCPWGCEPEKRISIKEGHRFLAKSLKLSGRKPFKATGRVTPTNIKALVDKILKNQV